MLEENLTECRFASAGGEAHLRRWRNGVESTMVFPADSSLPDWLLSILHVARAGQHIMTPKEPPPDEVVWFIVDDRSQLVRFVSKS